MNNLESENIFVLVGSCKSGGFADDLENSNRFIITSTDHYNDSVILPGGEGMPDNEPLFEHYFFLRISQGYGDRSSYFYAVTETQDEEPEQNPMYNDQISYSWFEWW